MCSLSPKDPLTIEIVQAIQKGENEVLERLLTQNETIANANVPEPNGVVKRTLLHIATDWPGHFPNVAETIRILIAKGADANVGVKGPGTETPLHWAASSNDVKAVDALLDGGADLNAKGAVIAGGDPLEDAIGFQNWDAARRLVERGASTQIGDEAALGLIDRLKKRFEEMESPKQTELDRAFWYACAAGQIECAILLFEKGADVDWIPSWCEERPLDVAIKSENERLVGWLGEIGARKA